jgi:hypothetical protein
VLVRLHLPKLRLRVVQQVQERLVLALRLPVQVLRRRVLVQPPVSLEPPAAVSLEVSGPWVQGMRLPPALLVPSVTRLLVELRLVGRRRGLQVLALCSVVSSGKVAPTPPRKSQRSR